MTPGATDRAATGAGPEAVGFATATVAKWLVGVRLVAVSALLVGTLLVQSLTDEILPIVPIVWVAGLGYALSLLWIVLWLLRVTPRLHASMQLAGDVAIISTLVYLTGGLWSPFPFLLLITVGVAALLFGLRGALTVAGGAFVVYAAMAEAMAYGLLPAPRIFAPPSPIGPSTLAFQVSLTGAGFALVALLTSYLAHSLQQAEARLRGQREATARAMALSADVLRSVDSGVVATDTHGTVVLANPATARIIRTDLPIEGRPVTEVLALDGVSWDRLFAAARDEEPMKVDSVLVGSSTPIGLTLTPLSDANAKPLGHVVHFRDLTEAQEVGRRERLRDRMATLGEMATAIAHEIRNPLASISGSAQVLGRVATLPPNERRLLQIIVEESRRLSGIIDSVLSFARPPEPQRAPCDVARTLRETLELFANSPEVTAKHIIDTQVRAPEGQVMADEQQLRQAFFNLAQNAIQAMPTGGTMRVVAAQEGGFYVVRWSDEGIGLEVSQTQEIFQPFRAFRKGGTGLGLAVVYTIVNEHRGDIDVASAPGKGTTFTLRLPMESP